jgi:hypothetical protein
MTQRALRIGFACASTLVAIAMALAPPLATAQQIRGCVQNSTGSVRIIAATDTCKNSETLTTWSITGPAGPKGDKGDPGAGLDTGTIVGQAVSCSGPARRALAFLPGESFVAVTGGDGTFRLSHVPPGTYRLTVETAGGESGTRLGIVVTAATTTAIIGGVNPSLLSDPANCGSCGHACAAGEICSGAECLPPTVCTGVLCPGGTACVGGICPPEACLNVLCPFGQGCINGACVAQGSCLGVTCAPGETCFGGSCRIPSSACTGVICPLGTTCVNGICQ